MSPSTPNARSSAPLLVSIVLVLIALGIVLALLLDFGLVATLVYIAVAALVFLGVDYVRTRGLGDAPDQ